MTEKDIYGLKVKNYCVTLAGQNAVRWVKDDMDFIFNSFEMKLSPIATAKEILKLHGIHG